MTRKRYTKEEDDRIMEVIQENPENLQKAFRILSEELNRSIRALTNRWYMVLNNHESPKYRGTTCFMTISKRKKFVNRKTFNTPSEKVKKNSTSIWTKILKLLRMKNS